MQTAQKGKKEEKRVNFEGSFCARSPANLEEIVALPKRMAKCETKARNKLIWSLWHIVWVKYFSRRLAACLCLINNVESSEAKKQWELLVFRLEKEKGEGVFFASNLTNILVVVSGIPR